MIVIQIYKMKLNYDLFESSLHCGLEFSMLKNENKILNIRKASFYVFMLKWSVMCSHAKINKLIDQSKGISII